MLTDTTFLTQDIHDHLVVLEKHKVVKNLAYQYTTNPSPILIDENDNQWILQVDAMQPEQNLYYYICEKY